MTADIVQLILHIQRNEFDLSITADDQPDLQNIQEHYQAPGGNFWVATIAGQIVGTVALLNLGKGDYSLRKMFVKSQFRGSSLGVASALLRYAESWALDRGAGAIYLGTTDRFLSAHRFYRKNNYRELPKSNLPESFPLMSVDTLFFVKSF